MIERAVSVLLAVAFSLLLLGLAWRHFGGWASRAQLARGGALSLLSMALAVVLSVALTAAFRPASDSEIAKVLTTAFLSAALAEETARWIALLLLSRSLVTNDPREFFCGAVAVGLGFGVLENVFYLFSAKNALALGALRGLLTAPGHLAYALVSAVGLWRWRNARGSFLDALFALAAAVVLHGSYDAAVIGWERLTGENGSAPAARLVTAAMFAAVALAIVAETVAMMLAIDAFVDWTSRCPAHDPRHAAQSRGGPAEAMWRAMPNVLSRLALLVLVSPLAIAAVTGDALGYVPVTLGLAAAIQLWSVAIAQLEASA